MLLLLSRRSDTSASDLIWISIFWASPPILPRTFVETSCRTPTWLEIASVEDWLSSRAFARVWRNSSARAPRPSSTDPSCSCADASTCCRPELAFSRRDTMDSTSSRRLSLALLSRLIASLLRLSSSSTREVEDAEIVSAISRLRSVRVVAIDSLLLNTRSAASIELCSRFATVFWLAASRRSTASLLCVSRAARTLWLLSLSREAA